jgi:xanthine dehydrogenase YagR molybdenum-binding subunit
MIDGHDEAKPAGDQPQYKTRYDGLAKVTGKARYAAEFSSPFPKDDLVYARIVQSTIPCGTILSIDSAAAQHSPGVLAVITPFNAPKLDIANPEPPARRHISVLQDTEVRYNGQPIAVVVAKTFEQARYAAQQLKVKYKASPAKLELPTDLAKQNRLGEARWPKSPGKESPADKRGDVQAGFAAAPVKLDQTYVTPIQYHNPLEPHATIAWWEGEKVSVYDATQSISGAKQTISHVFGVPMDNVRTQCPYTGGGFGCKGSSWSHVTLAVLAAKTVGKPVKLALDRSQMFGPVGYRATTHNRIRLGAAHDGKLTAIQQDVVMNASVLEDFVEHSGSPAKLLYASENNQISEKMIDTNLGIATFMRGPGETPGTAVLEIALDELAEKLNMDPLQLRLVNYAEKDPSNGKPWTSKHLKEAYQQGAEKFGWSKRNSKPGQKLEGNELIGYGMATATYPANRSEAQALVRVMPGGKVFAASGTQDLGTGMYTMIAQTAADTMGLDIARDPTLVQAALGDSMFPHAPVSGGSQSTASVTPAVQAAAQQVLLKLGELAVNDGRSPLHGLNSVDLGARDGRLFSKAEPSRSDSFADIVARNGNKPVEAVATSEPAEDHTAYTSYCWGAVFAEVGVDKSTYMPRVRRVVGVYDVGRLMNKTTGLHQFMGGIVWGISFALHEEGHIDRVYGRTVNNNLAEYHVPSNRDIGQIEVSVLDIPDTKFNPLGARGIGEIGATGSAAAVANAIYNATGKRIREYPITPDKIMLA